MILPIRAKNPPESTPWATYALIAINVLIFILTADGPIISESVVQAWALKSDHFVPLNLFTSMFLHGDVMHLLGNMWFLYLFGAAVEGRLKTFSFLTVYVAAGLAGSLAHHYFVGLQAPDIPTLGASGAIMGVLGAALYMFPHGKITTFWFFFFRWGTFDVPMWGVALFYLGGDFVSALIGAETGVAHLAHLGGALGGFLTTLFYSPQRDCKTASKVKAALSDVRDLDDLNPRELEVLWKQSPTDPHLTLSLMRGFQVQEVKPPEDCLEGFVNAIPAMLDDCDAVVVAETARYLTTASSSPIPAHHLVEIGARVELITGPGLASSLFATALADPHVSVPDRHLCLLKLGMLQERAGNPRGAADFYQRLADEDDWSPSKDDGERALEQLQRRRAS
ncbi:MAG: rhomboid family intramembrane serine protease [Armatimonadetes bacterium]|nr:rhomboid family intramembrane serine protease [Armatimonadota bacterium]